MPKKDELKLPSKVTPSEAAIPTWPVLAALSLMIISLSAVVGYYWTVLADGGIYGSADSRPELGGFVGFLVGLAVSLVISVVSMLLDRRVSRG